MARKCAAFLLAICLVAGASAQKGYIRAGAGYGVSLNFGHNLVIDGYPYTGSAMQPVNPHSFNKASLSSGSYATVAAGVRLASLVSLECSYRRAIHAKRFEEHYFFSPNYKTRVEIRAVSPSFLTPAAVFAADGPRSKPYVRVGLLLPLNRKIVSEGFATADSANSFYERVEWKTKYNAGFSVAGGYKLLLAGSCYLYGELNLQWLSLQVQESNLVACTHNSEDILYGRQPYQKQVIYVKGDDLRFYGVQDPDAPTYRPAYRIPFSNLSANVGLSFDF